MKNLLKIVGIIGTLAPIPIFAAAPADLSALIDILLKYINMVVPLIFGIAVVLFLWGVVKYVIYGDMKSKEDGRNFIVYGIIGLAVMLSVYGLVYFVKNSFFEGSTTSLDVRKM